MKKFVLFLLIFLFSYNLYSTKKVDVMDALLQSVIDYFSTKTPKFVDRYGADRFVADEPMTRGTILLLLYEYDQYLKTQQTIPDLSSIQKRIEAIEKKLTSIERQTPTAQPAKIDVFEIMKELTPNMPVMLDSTLTKSQVFNNLKKEIDELKQTAKLPQQPQQPQVLPSDISLKLEKLEKDYAVVENLKKELESLNVAQQQQVLPSKVSDLEKGYSKVYEEIQRTKEKQQKDLSDIRKDIEQISKQLARSEQTQKDLAELSNKIKDVSSKIEQLSKQQVVVQQPQQPQQPQVLPSDISLKLEKLEKDYAVVENLKKELESLNVAQQQQQTLLSKSQQPQQQAVSVQPEVSLQINNLSIKMKDFEEKINNLTTQQQNLLLELKKDIDALKTNAVVKTDIDKLQKNYSKLSVKFEEIEKQLSEKKEFTPQYYKKEEGPTYLSFLTKFSLGLSFLTLLFIAR
jgi:chromosome segregation ATPase